MKKNDIQHAVKNTALGLGALALLSCGGYSTVVKMPEVKTVPAGQYERIIKLNNPGSIADKLLAGLVFIKKGTKVCTDYPREETIKSLDELTTTEKYSYRYFSNYAIKENGKTFGFVSIPVEYSAILWKNEKDENCKYKVQIELVNKERGDMGEVIPKTGHDGGHGR